ncbi:hypothetical protein SAMN04489712_1048 [Thermomonospora echinospora]|uniref:Uncharacterized protein n=2 Tax=Thermomonospora echinospora TaxID=1992 RepID=A0A1H5YIX6_9ACTN|nr:hypothetical protein SAMN04489712_1048 [Thermomonospora echinospora]
MVLLVLNAVASGLPPAYTVLRWIGLPWDRHYAVVLGAAMAVMALTFGLCLERAARLGTTPFLGGWGAAMVALAVGHMVTIAPYLNGLSVPVQLVGAAAVGALEGLLFGWVAGMVVKWAVVLSSAPETGSAARPDRPAQRALTPFLLITGVLLVAPVILGAVSWVMLSPDAAIPEDCGATVCVAESDAIMVPLVLAGAALVPLWAIAAFALGMRRLDHRFRQRGPVGQALAALSIAGSMALPMYLLTMFGGLFTPPM